MSRKNWFVAIGMIVPMVMGVLSGCGSAGTQVTEASTEEASEKSDTSVADTASSTATEAATDAGEMASGRSFAGTTLELETTMTDDQLAVLQSIVEGFEQETGATVDIVAPGGDYETVMITRMASNDMPDIFETHGWSIMRYKDYLMTLNDQSWFSRANDSILGVIEDEDKNIYVLPLTQVVSGIIYNADVLEKAGVDPNTIYTWDDFHDACEKVAAIGITPINIGAKDSGNAAGFYGSVAPAMLTGESPLYDEGSALKDGTFDWNTYGIPVLQEIQNLVQKGYVNADATTEDSQTMQTALGSGECAFVFRHTANIASARTYVPDCNLGIIPIPSFVAVDEGGLSSYRVGEGTCWGIWKDTENEDAAKALLDYMAIAKNAQAIAETTGGLPALTDVTTESNYAQIQFEDSQKKFDGHVFYDNIFDREYMPSGMWAIMGDAVTMILSDPSDNTVKEANDYLAENYSDKFADAHAED